MYIWLDIRNLLLFLEKSRKQFETKVLFLQRNLFRLFVCLVFVCKSSVSDETTSMTKNRKKLTFNLSFIGLYLSSCLLFYKFCLLKSSSFTPFFVCFLSSYLQFLCMFSKLTSSGFKLNLHYFFTCTLNL